MACIEIDMRRIIMSFFEKIGKVAKVVGNEALDIAQDAMRDMQRKRERIDHYKEIYDRYSDEELKKKLNSTNDERKMAIIELLKERVFWSIKIVMARAN